jgi:hypothetical protein
MAAKDLMGWMRMVAWIGMVAQVMLKERTHLFVLCDYGCPRLDDLDETGGLDGSGGMCYVLWKKRTYRLSSVTMAAQDLMTLMGLVAWMELVARVT